MTRIARLLGATALAMGVPAMAGQEPLYRPAPEWIDTATLPADKSGPPILLFDDQRRIEEGRLWSYVDRAIRIDNPQILTAAGTIQAMWQPDKGDLIVHTIAIVRGGEVIDVLAGGARFDVLRRERHLEQRTLDGSLTATLPIPDLRVGDVLRLSYSVTSSDQALKQEVQAMAFLPSEPFDAKFARVRLSWPKDAGVKWQARGLNLGAPVVKAGYAAIDVRLPLPKQAEMPSDAPIRYQMPALLQVGTFADWNEVSAVMAPLFATEGTIAADGPIAREVTRIAATHSKPLDRAVAALRLVQDQVSYLANGMDGGNYIPQKPAETWDKRYGDCKAKTMLLLAMLREMGIEAEATVVSSQTGDAVSQMLPMPAAFDHVIVRAVIEGTEYWLDGTSAGASLAVVDEVPAFHFALPIRAGGADLIAMPQRQKLAFDRSAKISFDHRAGLDVPALYQAEWTLSGPSAAPFRAVIGQAGQKQIDEMLQSYVVEVIGDSQLLEGSIKFDPDSNTATVKTRGLMPSQWQWERGQGSREFALPSAGFQFRPDRSRAAWRDIPVALPGPFSEQVEMTVLLPDSEQPYSLDGQTGFDQSVAQVRLNRAAKLDGARLAITDSIAWPGGEIQPTNLATERARAARLGPLELNLRAPTKTPRAFDVAVDGNRKRFSAIEAAFAELITDQPNNAATYIQRAGFRVQTLDRDGALKDLAKAISIDPSADSYLMRSSLLADMGRLNDALADADAAWELYPSLKAAFARAAVLPYLGRVEEAIALLKDQSGDADERLSLATNLSDLEAQAGRKQDGLVRLEALLAQRPGDPGMLNAKCWYQGIWNINRDELPALCTKAVENAEFSPPVLDSRAMGYYRLGRYAEALHDLDAALSASPEQTPTLFMRGVVRREMGDREGDKDIRQALARHPSLKRYFAQFGIRAR